MYNKPCGIETGATPVGYGYGAPVVPATGGGVGGFTLIVVLFILLIIVGASWA
ncbi:YjcZ family sporulation protein [Cytobacillus sp. S13-E01]|uniref:YjcZ family sporulation protein n=1 Tax=Cytobacillus sp. S13-E01 TaxID=3031326 RepID=UPI0023D7D712|nr:YjcZ family sporulation protein [Cytobacillus sp. S13-E01]MDF0728187.1 YjcZ family sporulation protein [Cytobacillus sp. S13-E01]